MDIRKILNIIKEKSQPFKFNFEVTPIKKYLNEANVNKLNLNRLLQKYGEPVNSHMDAIARFSNGERLFVFHELDEKPLEVNNIDILVKYSADQILALPKNLSIFEEGDLGKEDVKELPFLKGIIDQESGSKIDLESFYKLITGRPTRMLKQNEKMQHSDGTSVIFFNIGLPAIKGLVGDEEVGPPRPGNEDKSFLMINTCPGAAACKIFCYVGKGGYVQWKASSLGMTRMLNFLYNQPEQFMEQLTQEIADTKKKLSKKGSNIVIRWHDAGDFFSPEYVKMAYEVAKKFPDVTFYAYTKMLDVAKGETPDNFVMNYSFGGKSDKKVDRVTMKHSEVVPKEMWSDLVVREKIPVKESEESKKLQNVQTQNLSSQDLQDYLDRILKGKKGKTDKYHYPYIHKSNIPILPVTSASAEPDDKITSQGPTKVKKKNDKEKTKSVLKYKDEQSIQELKNRLAKHYGIDLDSILTYDELITTPRSNERNKWNVIIKPGDGDVAASRKDVLGSYLLVH